MLRRVLQSRADCGKVVECLAGRQTSPFSSQAWFGCPITRQQARSGMPRCDMTRRCQAGPPLQSAFTSMAAKQKLTTSLRQLQSTRSMCSGSAADSAGISPYSVPATATSHNASDSTAEGSAPRKPVTVKTLRLKKRRGEKIVMTTAYDYPSANISARAGVDMLLVGDSLAMVVLGLPDTVSVTVDQMLHHCAAVSRGSQGAFVVGDMPFGSYTTTRDAVDNAVRFLKEGRVSAVKLEGGKAMAPQVEAISAAGIAVIGHIGLTPQSVSALGGYTVQGRSAAAAKSMLEDAKALQDAGAVAVVLEMVPESLAAVISEELDIPTIGIGAGKGCSGQVLVYHDMLGMYDGHVPRFVKQFARIGDLAVDALHNYKEEVRSGQFPQPAHSFSISEKAMARFLCDADLSHEYELDGSRRASCVSELAAVSAVSPSASARRTDVMPDRRAIDSRPTRIAVVGGGAMGSLFAAKLSSTCDVRMITSWEDHAKVASETGIRVLTPDNVASGLPGELHAPIRTLQPFHVMTGGPTFQDEAWEADLVLVLVKGHHTGQAAIIAEQLLSKSGVVLTLQNGATHLERLQDRVGSDKVLYGVTAQGATVVGPGNVLHAGFGATTVVSTCDELSPRADEVAALLCEIGMECSARPPSELAHVMVRKLATNACINPLTAMLGCKNGELVENSSYRGILRSVHSEVSAAAPGLGLPLKRVLECSRAHDNLDNGVGNKAKDTIAKLVPTLQEIEGVVCETAHNESSMLQDVKRGKETEIEFINGVILQAAFLAGVETPVNKALVDLIGSRAHA